MTDDERRGPLPARPTGALKQELVLALGELRRGGLGADAEERIETFFVVADAFEADGLLMQATACLDDLLGRLRQVLESRAGRADPAWLFTGEDDLLAYRDAHNLHVIDERYVTGAQPSEVGYRWLARKGVETVVNLRLEDSRDRAIVEALGLRYVHLSWPDEEAPTVDQVTSLVGVVTRARGRVFQHCLRGIGRDLTMACCYRIVTARASASELIQRMCASSPRWVSDQVTTARGEQAQFAFLHRLEGQIAR